MTASQSRDPNSPNPMSLTPADKLKWHDSTVFFQSVGDPPFRNLCTDCGVSRSSSPEQCGSSCQFIKPDYDTLENSVHGRARKTGESDELYFGVVHAMYKARLKKNSAGAQWTGITTRLAEKLLETDNVDAVLTVAPDESDRWKPVPVLIKNSEDLVNCRGMRMGYAPLLTLLDRIREENIKRLAVIGIPCQIYALRSLEAQLKLDRLYVIGTPCSDNTTTERFHEFLALLDPDPSSISYLEFRADFHVELRYDDGRARDIPFLQLPLSNLPNDFFPMTCRTCVDYTNALSDITVGYMAGEGDQWVIVRNERGEELLNLLGDLIHLESPGSKGRRHSSVSGFRKNIERASGGLPLRSMPSWLRPIVAWLMPRVGPRGLEFARARVEMKAIESVIHLKREYPNRIKHMIPDHVRRLAERYGVFTENDA